MGEPTTSPFSGGAVYIYIDSDVSNKNRIYDAINEWESATVLDFIELSSPGSNTSSNWIHFKSSTSGCSSTIANFQTLNVVRLSSSCTVNNIKHEIGHAIGLFHEHQRIDRDDYLEIFWSNIPEESRNNYRLLNTLIYSFTLGDGYSAFSEGNFDFNSIMIYNTFQTINGSQVSVLVKKSDGSQIIKTGDITLTDAETVNRLINDDIDEKLMFSPYDVIIDGSKGSNQFTLNWDHVGSIQGLSSPPNEFWLFTIDPGSNDEWILDSKIIGGSQRNHSLNLNWRNPPRYRLAAVNSNNGSFSASDEAVYDFTGNCSCTDDFEMIDAVYIEDSQDFYYYQVGWTETPSGYPTIELGYTENSGSRVTLKDNFNGCETGWEWFYLPSPSEPDGPASFWLKAVTASGYVRYCNGNLSTGSFQPKNK